MGQVNSKLRQEAADNNWGMSPDEYEAFVEAMRHASGWTLTERPRDDGGKWIDIVIPDLDAMSPLAKRGFESLIKYSNKDLKCRWFSQQPQ